MPKASIFTLGCRVNQYESDAIEEQLLDKKFEIVPMTVDEAILQMNLLSHEFYLFRNAETGILNVVYKRKENDYGVIEPVE